MLNKTLKHWLWDWLSVGLFLVLYHQVAFAQAPPRFEAICNVKETLTDEPFEVVFQLQNGRVRNLEPPSFSRLEAQGPSVSLSVSAINGRSTQTESYRYYVRASKPGTYRIAPATVITSTGESLRSKPLTIKVVQAKKRANAYANKVMIQTEVSSEQILVGEQVNVDLRMYKLVDLNTERPMLVRGPDFGDAFVYDLNSFSDRGEYVVIDGQQYYTQLIQRWAVFPNKPGKLVIPPIIIDVNINEAQGGSGLFRPYRLIRNRVQTDSVVVSIQDMDGGPPGYEGTIGNYQLLAHVERNTITSDEVVEVTVRLQGQGNVKTILPPRMEGDHRYFEQFDPSVDEQAGMVNNLYGGIKDYTYIFTPKAEGTFTLRPTLVYFNTQQRKFVTLDTTLQITVQRGNAHLPSKAGFDTVQTASARILAEEEGALLSFREPVATATWVDATPTYWWGSWSFWLLLCLPFISLAGLWPIQRARARRAALPDALRRQAAAGSEAQRRLQTAHHALTEGQASAFYKAISSALLGFVKDRYQLSNVELTKQNVQEHLVAQQVDPTHVETLMHLLVTAEQALFAGLNSGTSMEQTYQKSKALLQALDE